jgi:3'-phosphoadenosine 5'-phosphosulfate sulfotransferase (PAPS reductase)/FAD synthetase
MSIVHVVSLSGGKDSLATALIALKRFPRSRIIFIFCDTGNEHESTYNYIAYLEFMLDIKVITLRASFDAELAAKRMFIARDQRTRRDKTGRKVRWTNKHKRMAMEVLRPSGNPFLDLCLWKGRFPSRMAQFCTQELKRNPAVEFQMALAEQGHTVVSWQGVRRDESARRANALKFEPIGGRMYIYRPIVDWTSQMAIDAATEAGIDSNPLYRQGMNRVGCMPCINVGKDELAQIALRFPEEIARISAWERLVSMASKRGFSTMMADGHDAKDRREVFADLNIWSRVEWAKTTRGGKQYDLLGALPEDAHSCSSAYGLCE